MPAMKRRRRTYDPDKWQLTRERFQIADPAPPAPDADALPVADFVDDILKNMKLDSHAKAGQITEVWPEIVGPQIARHTRPGHYDNQLLTVFVSHPAWLMELRGAPAREILTRLQDRFGAETITDIRWTIDPGQP
jgi:predicted nucleic acid-binding Zn ribbon protein